MSLEWRHNSGDNSRPRAIPSKNEGLAVQYLAGKKKKKTLEKAVARRYAVSRPTSTSVCE